VGMNFGGLGFWNINPSLGLFRVLIILFVGIGFFFYKML